MDDDLYQDKLEWYKQNEKPEVVLLIADDKERTKLLVAWTNTACTRSSKITELSKDSEDDVWQWLWDNTKFSLKELMTKSAISEFKLNKQLQFLIGNRIIYPDGTINSFVQRYLREKVLKLFDAKPKRVTNKISN